MAGSNDVRLAVWNGAITIVALLGVVLATASHDPRRLAWILLALGLSAAGLAVQRSGLAVDFLNHNDLCHVLQTAALWPFYRAGLRLRDLGDARLAAPAAPRSVVSVKIEPSGTEMRTTPAVASFVSTSRASSARVVR